MNRPTPNVRAQVALVYFDAHSKPQRSLSKPCETNSSEHIS